MVIENLVEELIFADLPSSCCKRATVDEETHISKVVLDLLGTRELEYLSDLCLQGGGVFPYSKVDVNDFDSLTF